MQKVAALYVAKGGCYYGLEGVDPWDEERDARKYAGPWPVVAHPPCNRWAQPLAQVNQTRYGHKVGDDGGCFQRAVECVERYGGVLEHPANTAAWAHFKLPKPLRGCWSRCLWSRGWVTNVSQSAYGHRARKATWLYWVGPGAPPELDWSDPEPSATVSWLPNTTMVRPRLSKREAKATPLPFRDLLLELARRASRVGP